jgi:ribosome-associated toxin RatA of RatAB toxin-antitoxin module
MPINFWKRKEKSPQWRPNPGAFERHLQLRYNNPIFPSRFRLVTIQEIEEARDKDDHNADQFNNIYAALLQEVSRYPDIIPFEQVSQIRDRIDKLLDLAATVGNSVAEQTNRLRELREMITTTSYEKLAEQEHKEAYTKLQQAEQFNRSGRDTFRNPFVAQIRQIPAEELIPRLLSEDVETISGAMKALDDNAIKTLQVASIARFQEIIQERSNPDDPLIDELIAKLEAMGIDAGNPQ